MPEPSEHKYFPSLTVFVERRPDDSLRMRVRQQMAGTPIKEWVYGSDLIPVSVMTWETANKAICRKLVAYTDLIEFVYDASAKAGVSRAFMYTYNGRFVDKPLEAA